MIISINNNTTNNKINNNILMIMMINIITKSGAVLYQVCLSKPDSQVLVNQSQYFSGQK